MQKQYLSKMFSDELVKLAAKYKKLVVMDADLAASSRVSSFVRNFDDRYLHFGLSEESMVACAAAFAARGWIPFVCSDALYLTGQAYTQIRNMLAYPNLNVKLVGFDSGLALGEEGPMMHCLEDISLMRSIPNMKIYSPADTYELKSCMKKICEDFGPSYLRLSAGLIDDFHDENQDCCDLNILREGSDVCVLATGAVLGNVLQAAEYLEKHGTSVRVVNIALLKPLNEEKLLKVLSDMNSVFVVEDHFKEGGLGSIVAELLISKYPIPMKHLAVNSFSESAGSEDLYKKFGLDIESLSQFFKL